MWPHWGSRDGRADSTLGLSSPPGLEQRSVSNLKANTCWCIWGNARIHSAVWNHLPRSFACILTESLVPVKEVEILRVSWGDSLFCDFFFLVNVWYFPYSLVADLEWEGFLLTKGTVIIMLRCCRNILWSYSLLIVQFVREQITWSFYMFVFSLWYRKFIVVIYLPCSV